MENGKFEERTCINFHFGPFYYATRRNVAVSFPSEFIRIDIGLSVDWIGLAQNRYRWRALVNSVMILRVPTILGIYRVAAQLVASRVLLSSTELVS
jgi:hypothetical protein